jgi:hypothetical protein
VKKRVRFKDLNLVKSPALQHQLDTTFCRECLSEEVFVVELNPEAEVAIAVAPTWKRGSRVEKSAIMTPHETEDWRAVRF